MEFKLFPTQLLAQKNVVIVLNLPSTFDQLNKSTTKLIINVMIIIPSRVIIIITIIIIIIPSRVTVAAELRLSESG